MSTTLINSNNNSEAIVYGQNCDNTENLESQFEKENSVIENHLLRNIK